MENSTDNNSASQKFDRTEMDTDDIDENLKDDRGDSLSIIGRCYELLSKEEEGKASVKTSEGLIVHYYIEKLKDGRVALEMVGRDGELSGKLIDKISMKDFSNKFTSCSQHNCMLQSKTVEDIVMKMSESRTRKGEEHLQKGELEEAEDLFRRALYFDKDNVEASLGLGVSKMEQAKEDEAMTIFKEMSDGLAIYEEQNKHLFNEFGIYLRKKGLYTLAVNCYEQAIAINQDDEILYFNLSRAYGDKGLKEEEGGKGVKDIQKAIGILKEALMIKNEFEEAKRYLKALTKREELILNRLLET